MPPFLKTAFVVVLLSTGCPDLHGQSPDFKEIHKSAIVVDMHNDVAQRMLAGEDISFRTSTGHSDRPRFVEGGLDVCFFSIWVPPGETSGPYYRQANRQIDSVLAFVKRNPGTVGLAGASTEIESLVSAGKFVAMMGMEGGHPIGNRLDRIDHFYRRGVRYMTLTWNNSTDWATSAKDEEERKLRRKRMGLTEFGKKVIRRMNDIGMMIDVSHVGEQTFRDVIRTTRKPVIASHSSVWNICPNRRNLKDDQIRAIAKTGGAVFVNFAPFFIDSSFSRKEADLEARRSASQGKQDHASDSGFRKDPAALRHSLEEEMKSIRPPLSLLIDHFVYIASLVGTDHVGIGSDFDGIHVTPLGMDDVTFLPELTRELLARGYSRKDVGNILGGNLLRILREVESGILRN